MSTLMMSQHIHSDKVDYIRLEVHNAALAGNDPPSSSYDPYCIVGVSNPETSEWLETSPLYKTEVLLATCNPNWASSFEIGPLSLLSEDGKVLIQVMDKRSSGDALIGSASFQAGLVDFEKRSFSLTKNGEIVGKISVSYHFSKATADSSEAEWAMPREKRSYWSAQLEYARLLSQRKVEKLELSEDQKALARGDPSVAEKMPAPHKLIRIFTSSTFTDTEQERNALMKDVYPYLTTLCKTLGLEFEVVDMRWGVREFVSDDHKTSDLCLKELKKSLSVSSGPAFVCILGNKYGHRPFPSSITAKEMDVIWESICKQHFEAAKAVEAQNQNSVSFELLKTISFSEILSKLSDEQKALLNQLNGNSEMLLLPKWFRLDLNELEPTYVLQNITAVLPNFRSKDIALKKEADAIWRSDFKKMQRLLRSGAKALPSDSDYHISVTHYEVNQEGVQEEPPSRRFVDVDVESENKVDKEAQTLLSGLKKDVQVSLSQKSILKENVSKSELGIAGKDAGHTKSPPGFCPPVSEAYLRRFCDSICSGIIKLTIAGYVKETGYLPPFFAEILRHQLFARDKLQVYLNRRQVEQEIEKYIDDTSATRPLVLYARSGGGKTALMAYASRYAFQKHPGSVVITRFLGTTPQSSDVIYLLTSVCNQIIEVYGLKKVSFEQYTTAQLAEWLRQQLEVIANKKPSRPLILILDSLDQLSPIHNAHALTWLPLQFLPGIHVIVSVLTVEGLAVPNTPDLLKTLQELISDDQKSFVKVPTLSKEEGLVILQGHLTRLKRKLSDEQREMLEKGFSACPVPLYLTVACDVAKTWASYTPIAECMLEPSIRGLIDSFFERIEKIHGKVLVSHALRYLTAARYGFSSSDMDGLLSCDDVVLRDVFTHWVPPVLHLPPLLWTRIREDIGVYIAEQGVYGVTVYRWFHRQFWEAAQDRYYSKNPETVAEIHAFIARYFDGEFSSPKKLPHYDSKLEPQDRMIPAQPIYYTDTKCNQHKLSELPYHQIKGKLPLNSSLFNFEFIEAKISSNLGTELLDDYRLALKNCDRNSEHGQNLRQFERFLTRNILYLTKSPKQLLDYALSQGCSSLLFVSGKDYAIEKTKRTEKVNAVSLSRDDRILVSASTDTTLIVWDAISGIQKKTLKGHASAVNSCAVLWDGTQVVSASDDATLILWDIPSASVVRKFIGHTDKVNSCSVTEDGSLLISGSSDCTMRLWDLKTGAELHTFQQSSSIYCCSISRSGKLAVSGGDKYIAFWDIPNRTSLLKEQEVKGHRGKIFGCDISFDETLICTVSMDCRVKIWNIVDILANKIRGPSWVFSAATWVISCVFGYKDTHFLVSACEDGTANVWELIPQKEVSLPTDMSVVNCVAFSPDGKSVVSGTVDGNVKHWDVEQASIVAMMPVDEPEVGVAMGPSQKPGVYASRFSPNGEYIISGSDDNHIRIWDFKADKTDPKTPKVHTLKGHKAWIRTFVITPDSKTIVSCSWDGEVLIWDAQAYQLKFSLPLHSDAITCCVLAEDGKTIVTGSLDNTLKSTNIVSGKEITNFIGHTNWVLVCDVSQDKKLVASGSLDNTIKIWDFATGKEILTLTGHIYQITVCKFLPGSSGTIVSASFDRTIMVWNVNTGKEVHRLIGHSVMVEEIFFVNRDTFGQDYGVKGTQSVYITSQAREEIFLWDLSSGKLLAKHFLVDANVSAFALYPNIPFSIAVGRASGLISFLVLIPPSEIPQLEKVAKEREKKKGLAQSNIAPLSLLSPLSSAPMPRVPVSALKPPPIRSLVGLWRALYYGKGTMVFKVQFNEDTKQLIAKKLLGDYWFPCGEDAWRINTDFLSDLRCGALNFTDLSWNSEQLRVTGENQFQIWGMIIFR